MIYKRLPLMCGKFAIIDKNKYNYLRGFKWMAHFNTKNNIWCVTTTVKLPNGKQYAISMHRYLKLGTDFKNPGKIVHINHNGLDNRMANLALIEEGS